MKLKSKLMLSTVLVFVLFILSLAVALAGMHGTKSRFESFLDEDQALQQSVSTMYAQGLQMGQALRNIVMNPANKIGYKNLDDASKAFEQATVSAMALAKPDPAAVATLKEVVALRERQKALQAKIVTVAAQGQAQAIMMISNEETPVWRAMRSRLMDFIKLKNEAIAGQKSRMIASTREALATSLGLAVLAVVAGVAMMIWLTASIMRQLGGEPEYAANIARDISGGDFSTPVAIGPNDKSSLLFAMDTMRGNLNLTLSDIRHSTDMLDRAVREIAAGNADLSERTASQASSLEETSSSMEEFTTMVRQNADNARLANQLAVKASDIAVQGGGVVAQVVNTMGSIRESSNKIVDIIAVIDSIAFQTNILALNAAVEAARAGEQGRGFAVVAGEVRQLAQRSAGAAKEIKSLIVDSVQRIGTGSGLVDRAGHTMDDIVASVKQVADILSEITVASQEQSAGIEQVNQAVTQMDQTTQQNAALVEQTAAAANSLVEQGAKLRQAMSQFQVVEVLPNHRPT